MKYIDIHTHKPNNESDVFSLLNIRLLHDKLLQIPKTPFRIWCKNVGFIFQKLLILFGQVVIGSKIPQG